MSTLRSLAVAALSGWLLLVLGAPAGAVPQ
jgi:hypothetical protein